MAIVITVHSETAIYKNIQKYDCKTVKQAKTSCRRNSYHWKSAKCLCKCHFDFILWAVQLLSV